MAEKMRGRIRAYSGQHIRFRPPGPREDRLLKVPNLQLRPDEPVDLGVASLCEECLLCVAKCPARAIPHEPLWWRGVYKRKVNDLKCWPFFSNFKGCAVCINSCPFHRFGYDAERRAYGGAD